MIDLQKLDLEIKAAGISFDGVADITGSGESPWSSYAHGSDLVRVDYSNAPTEQQIATVTNLVAAHDGTLPLGQVSCTTTGNKLIGVVGVNGQSFLPREYTIWASQIVALTGSVPTASLGTNSPNYNNILPATPLTSWAAGEFRRFEYGYAAKVADIRVPTYVYVKITVAAVATKYILDARFEGDLRLLPT